jgi:hypothetical protein
LRKIANPSDEKAHATFNVSHREPPSKFAPGAQLGRI